MMPRPRAIGGRHVARVHSGLRKGVRMAIVVLVLWLFTAGAGFSLLATGNLGRTRPAARAPAAAPATASPAPTPAASTPAQPRLHPGPARLHPGPARREAAEPCGEGPVRSAFAGRGEERAGAAGAAVAAGVRAPGLRDHRPGVLAGLYARALPAAGMDRVRAGDGHGMPGPQLVRGRYCAARRQRQAGQRQDGQRQDGQRQDGQRPQGVPFSAPASSPCTAGPPR